MAGILDEKFYKEWMFGAFVRDWNAAADFIQRERWRFDNKSKVWLYQSFLMENYQKMATSWSKDAKVLNEKYSEHPAQTEGLADEPLPENPDVTIQDTHPSLSRPNSSFGV